MTIFYDSNVGTENQVVNVKSFGAKGDGVNDDSQAIQNAINSIYSEGSDGIGGGTLYIPAGRYLIGTTLNINKLRGFVIRGEGGHEFDTTANVNFPQTGSHLIWIGAASGTLMRITGTQFSMYDIAFWGSNQGISPIADVLVQISYQSGIGAGHLTADNISFANAAVGVNCGEALGDANCADLSWGKVRFKNCDIGYQLNNSQSMNHIFNSFYIDDATIAIAANAGGVINCQHLHTVRTTTVLYSSGNGAAVGENNGMFYFGTIKIDGTQNGTTPRIVHFTNAVSAGDRIITIGQLLMPNATILSDGIPPFHIAGSTNLNVHDWKYFRVDETAVHLDASSAYKPSALFTNCTPRNSTIPSEWNNSAPFVSTSGSNARWGFQNCRTYQFGYDLPSIGNHGGVSHILSGAGTPESALSAPIGTLYIRTDGGTSTTLYVKESGTGNTGWVAK